MSVVASFLVGMIVGFYSCAHFFRRAMGASREG